MITLKQAIELATEAHEDQCRKNPTLVKSNEYDVYIEYLKKYEQTKFELPDGNYLQLNTKKEYEIVKPYITHPLAVMNMMVTDEEKIVAVLHDVFEINNESSYYLCRESKDTCSIYDEKQNIDYSISKEIYNALLLITKSPSEPYKKYIERLSKNKLAIKVKIADMMHNMSESNNPKQKEKYLKALPILLKAL